MGRTIWNGRSLVVAIVGAGGILLGYGVSILVPSPGTLHFWGVAAQPLATAFAGFGAISAGYLAFRNGEKGRRLEAQHHSENAQRDRESNLRDRYTTAATQLADSNPAIREAGAYAIAALAEDWDRLGVTSNQRSLAHSERQVCVNLLCSYLRANRQLLRPASPMNDLDPPAPSEAEVEERAARATIAVVLVDLVAGNSDWRLHVRLDGADLVKIDLSTADLQNASMQGVNLSRASLHGINLTSANLTGATLRSADLTLGLLRKATLQYADLTSCIMKEVDLQGAGLYQAKLSGAHMDRAKLNGADLADAKLIKTQLSEATMVEVNLDGADMSRAILKGVDLTGAQLDLAELTNADLTGADLIAAYLVEADLDEANLTDADLSFADLTNAKLVGADLTRADLTGANLLGADFDNARYDQSTIWPAGFTPPDQE